jgi:hypothetical protein
MVSSVVAYDAVLVKDHMPNFDVEILRRDFTINEVEREVLVECIYDIAQYFVSKYDFSALAESDDNNSSGTL